MAIPLQREAHPRSLSILLVFLHFGGAAIFLQREVDFRTLKAHLWKPWAYETCRIGHLVGEGGHPVGQ